MREIRTRWCPSCGGRRMEVWNTRDDEFDVRLDDPRHPYCTECQERVTPQENAHGKPYADVRP